MRRRKLANPAVALAREAALPLVGMAWFTPENFPAHRTLDPESLQDGFAEWLHYAESMFAKLTASGFTVERVLWHRRSWRLGARHVAGK
jgi:hypothetical protein